MLDTLNFFNGTHNGDIHFSREFIKHFMAIIPAKRYVSYHPYSHKLIMDIPNLEHKAFGELPFQTALKMTSEEFRSIKHTVRPKRLLTINRNRLQGLKFMGSNLFINTALLAGLLTQDGNVGCGRILKKRSFIDNNYNKFSHVLSLLKIQTPLKAKIEYVPTINYDVYEIEKIKDFVDSHKGPKVLVCNGDVRSSQIHNFSFNPYIEEIKKTSTVITTQKTGVSNVYYTGDIIQAKNGDLNEISYLSKFCDIIIGRGSGPFCYCETKENYFNERKRMISITKWHTWAFWWFNRKNMRWINTPERLVAEYQKAMKELSL